MDPRAPLVTSFSLVPPFSRTILSTFHPSCSSCHTRSYAMQPHKRSRSRLRISCVHGVDHAGPAPYTQLMYSADRERTVAAPDSHSRASIKAGKVLLPSSSPSSHRLSSHSLLLPSFPCLVPTRWTVPPKWLIEARDTSVLAGARALIDCQADGLPPPSVRWSRTDGQYFFFTSCPCLSATCSLSSRQSSRRKKNKTQGSRSESAGAQGVQGSDEESQMRQMSLRR